MEMLSVCVIVGSVLGVYFFVRKLNEIWHLVKLGRRVYKSLPPGDLGWPLIGSSLSFYRAFKAGGDPDSFIHRLISRYISSSLFHSLVFRLFFQYILTQIYIQVLFNDVVMSVMRVLRDVST